MDQSFLSICIPTHNRAQTLQETLNSILSQVDDDSAVEVLVSDNASSDETQMLVARYAAKYACLRYHRNPQNLGFDGNVIACIEQARGEYVSFFSDDDLAPPGLFSRVLAELTRHEPAILYLNHYPFYDDDYRRRGAAKHPAQDRVFGSGKEFLLCAGLGFISALTLKTDYAREFVASVKWGRGQAHLDIAARIALLKNGPFVFLGTQAVAARAAPPSYDGVTFSAINEARLYHELQAEGLLDADSVARRVSSSIKRNLLRAVLAKKCLGDAKHLAAQSALLRATYGRYPSLYFYVYPVLLLPRALVAPPYLLARAWRRWRERVQFDA